MAKSIYFLLTLILVSCDFFEKKPTAATGNNSLEFGTGRKPLTIKLRVYVAFKGLGKELRKTSIATCLILGNIANLTHTCA